MFLIFAGDDYYPLGGWRDYKGDAPTLESAMETVNNMASIEWWQIVSGGVVVAKGNRKT